MEEHVERTLMSDRELMRATVLARVVEGELTSAEGAELLALLVLQVKRLRKRFVSLGAKGLAHGSLSKPSNHAHPEALRTRVIELIQERYSGGAVQRGAVQRGGPARPSRAGSWPEIRSDPGVGASAGR